MFSLKAKIGLGIIFSYTSFEVYMALRTQFIISQRKKEFDRLQASSSTNVQDVDLLKFKSATVSGMFVNPFDEYRPQTAFEFIFVRVVEAFESIYGSHYEVHQKPLGDTREIEDILKLHTPNLEKLRENSAILAECRITDNFKGLTKIRDSMCFTWIGQSCALVQISGINILTDPILSSHLLSEHFGPKRLVPAPMDLDLINYATNDNLDIILVSHDHPDHLELDLTKKIGNKSLWIVPLGLKQKLGRRGIYNVIEMDWWDNLSLNRYIKGGEKLTDEYEIVCLPTMHWSGRYVLDCNRSLWCSYMIRRNGKSILFHAGDTGYLRDLFETIGKLYGPVDLSMVPIGQYCPSWHQKPRHTSPAESFLVAEHLRLTHAMGVHWGTFKISSEPILEPKLLFEKLALEKNKQGYKVPELGYSYWYDLNN